MLGPEMPFVNRRTLVAGVAIALALRAIWLLWLAWPFTADDALISVRYAQHLAAGRGLVWNEGEAPVEGYSNFLSVLVGAGAIHLGLSPIIVLKAVGGVAAALSLVLVYLVARLWVGPFPALAPVAVLTAFHGFALWAVSGMETPVFVTAVLAAVYLAYSERPVAAGLLVCVSGLVRPEGPLVGLAIGTGYLVYRDWPTLVRFAVAAVAPYTIYFAWRLLEFGRPFPNTVYCKAASTAPPWAVASQLLVVALPCLALMLGAKLDRRHLSAVTLAALYVLILYRVDTAVSSYHRFDLAVSALLLAVASATFMARWTARPRAALAACTIGVAALWPTHRMVRAHALSYLSRESPRRSLAAWLNVHLSRADSYVMGDVGLVGTLVDRRMLDALCLTNGAMTRPPIDRDAGRYAGWLLAQRPAAIVISSKRNEELVPAGTLGVFPALLRHPGFGLYRQDTVFRNGSGAQYWVFTRGLR
jgi:hypothetical protein